MSSHETVEAITRRESRGSIRLWFGLLAPPTAWATQLIVNYSLEEWFACSSSSSDSGSVLGVSVGSIALVTTSVLLAISLLGLAISFGCYRRSQDTDEVSSRARWMALAGILNGILYTILIVASYGVPLILESCRTTP
jgi:hypothetical protein